MDVLFENTTNTNADEKLINSVIAESLKYEGISDNCEISVTIVNDNEIHSINLKHRGIDRPTDVLSFPLIDFTKDSLPSDNSKIYLGDIVISIETAVRQAKEYGHSINREIGFLTAHSMLHLLGYDHMTKEEEEIMFKKQEEILNRLDLRR
ncbi:MAG: rRNA maturation RNase YbeY [Clostridia bacterium]|nr:rRNA maturation RNase YbeY [Clostridia bacterium]